MVESNVLIVPADQADRKRILTDLDTTLLVEAGAGSGKTTSLVGRLLVLIKSGVNVGHIAAITFTNKAADEMKERFRLALEKAYLCSADGLSAQERLSVALGNLDLLFIGTIHSFCGSLLRERPIEAGLDPSFEELDEENDKRLRTICWDEYMSELNEAARKRFEELLSLRVDVNTLRGVYDRVSSFTDVELPCMERERPNFERIRDTLFPLLDAAAPYIPIVEPEKGWDTVQKLVRQTNQKMRLIDLSDDMRILEIAKEFDRKLDVTLNRWNSKEHASEMKKQFADWQINVLIPFLREWHEYMYPKLISFVQPVLAYYQELRYAAGKLNFQDLLMEATKLVRENEEVRTYFSERYQRLLVDEFQDTDPIQAELMFLLTGSTGDISFEKDWRRLTPRPGSLFVVGDPKQSIYRFRRADISIYNEVKARILECGAVLRLTSNFRSVSSIGDFINDQFVGKLPASETEHQAAFVKMETHAPDPKGGDKTTHGIYVLNYPKMPGGKVVVAQTDADQIARYVSWACKDGNLQIANGNGGTRDAVPSDFLILTKTREFIHLYAEQLDWYGIPADTSGSTTVYEELLALWQLVRCLEDFADKPSLLAVMRGMLFGLSDRQLWAYKREGFRFSLFDLPDPATCSDEAKPVVIVLEKLRLYADWIRMLSASTAFSRIIEDLGVLPYVSTLPAGSVRAGTLVRMLQLVYSNQAASSSWSELCQFIEEMLTDRGMETSSLYAGGNQAVRIMNLHKAKGLEAPVVFLACPCGESDHDATQHIDRTTEPATGYFTISRDVGEFKKEVVAQPYGWEIMNELERTFSNAEKDRLLYVAATRPKQMLVISLYPDQPAKCPWSPLMDGMNDARELDVPVMEAEKKAEVNERPDLTSVMKNRQQKLEAIGAPTYALLSVTGQTKTIGDKPEWSSEGKGMAFGSVVHRSLEMMGKGLSDFELADAVSLLAEEEELDAQHFGEAVRIVRNVIDSDLWQRSLRARRRLFEVPLMLRKPVDEISLLSGGAEHACIRDPDADSYESNFIEFAYVRGVIDFLFEEEDGWVIVDFKTDSVPAEKLQSFVDFYRLQVLAYATEWENVFGYKVKEAGLYFTQLATYEVLI
ncbi:ATP-dependent helicase/nuclease subunit A [Paenibacillus endophyticus]|uniref:DNA 3'-5' helicase n=1 Tax=Paenibacillus endophyticus TaxID=1294268 RepID=A0A7W5CD07_9BACL|nr:UvrD-helicase domain-containing protein [Paenibacillus endophyticus]MBB3155458.1 ATP-dependent helicase/nuclease subunit A [Paenibacillus endophyticus]